ncbi:hypothetical protein ICN48_10860 [Polynucleobacter sp. JS-Safj-400b-B2]|uniref:hypothetical protein n=1 Tax=Polynucleobacter sp. JS-Safj-400b-B2 TaxID=2576921 RepID=UPI001C0BDFE6|nr:hypothetical protein [Polynucleobacter sp. JS-Safj-400b-B2]MBU3626731.1 hypothetical protein [Polynucleobacter sp. JS-Safj-400b-B2]
MLKTFKNWLQLDKTDHGALDGSSQAVIIEQNPAYVSVVQKKKNALDERIKKYKLEIRALNTASQDLQKENQVLLAQLLSTQESVVEAEDRNKKLEQELKKVQDAKANEFQSAKASLEKSQKSHSESLAKVEALLAAKNQEVDKVSKTTSTLNSEIEKLKSLASQEKASAAKYLLEKNQASATVAKLQSEIEVLKGFSAKEGAKTQQELAQAKADSSKKLLEIEALNQRLGEQEANLEKVGYENELLLKQLFQIQESLERYDNEVKGYKSKISDYELRWGRLVKNQPNIIDFESLEILSEDPVSSPPSLTFRIENLSLGQHYFSKIDFSLIFGVNDVSISILDDDAETVIFNPKQVALNAEGQKQYRDLSYLTWKKIVAASKVLQDSKVNQWSNLSKNSVDIVFWESKIANFCDSVNSLPPVLRFEEAQLKRELINPDYEHLWIKLSNVDFGVYSKPVLELRFSAALITDPKSFSQFPKIEFPLINGKDKPFESWFPESRDEFGPKFELRFSLEKQVFDLAAIQKLSASDSVFVVAMCRQIPNILERLEGNRISISRPWANWQDMASSSVAIIDKLLKGVTKAAPTMKQASSESIAATSPARAESPPVESAKLGKPAKTPKMVVIKKKTSR